MTENIRIRGNKNVARFSLIGTKDAIYLFDNVRTKTNRVGLSGIKTIVGLGLSFTKAIFLCGIM